MAKSPILSSSEENNKNNNEAVDVIKYFYPMAIIRRMYLSAYLFSSKSILDLSASSAFYFFLSIIPMTLLIVYVLDISIAGYGKLSDYFFMLLSEFNPQLNKEFFEQIGLFKNEKKSFFGVIGIIGLIWSSRSVFNGVRITLDMIFSGNSKRGFLTDNLISLIFVPLIVAGCILIFMVGVIVKNLALLFEKFGVPYFAGASAMSVYSNMIIAILVFVASFCLYRFLPTNRPKSIDAVFGAALFTFFAFILQKGLSGVITMASYYLVYGVISTLIVGLFWVYILFAMFYFFAQYVYVEHMYKEFEFINYYLNKNGYGNFVENLLFSKPHDVLKSFSKVYDKDFTIYRKNEPANNFYILLKGKVKIKEEYGNNEVIEYIVGEEETFAESAAISKAMYNNTAVTLEKCQVIEIPRKFYENVSMLEPKIQQIILNYYLQHQEMKTNHQ